MAFDHLVRVSSGQHSEYNSESQARNSQVARPSLSMAPSLTIVQFPPDQIPKEHNASEETYITGRYPNEREVTVPFIYHGIVCIPEGIAQNQSWKVAPVRAFQPVRGCAGQNILGC